MPPRKTALRPQVTNIAQLKSWITGTAVTARSEALQGLSAKAGLVECVKLLMYIQIWSPSSATRL